MMSLVNYPGENFSVWGSHDKMNWVWHEAVGPYLNTKRVTVLCYQARIIQIVPLSEKYLLTVIASLYNVMWSVWIRYML